MTSTTESQSSTRREIQVEVPAEVVSRETETVVQRMQRMARLPGFRRGKVPAGVIRQRFAEEIKSEVVENLVPRFFRQESEKQGLSPVSQPRVSDLHIAEGEPLRFKASFEVLPPIELSGYQELRVEKSDTAVSDKEVEDSLAHLREQHAAYAAVEDRPLADGDFAQVSFQATPLQEGEGGKPVEMEDAMLHVGGPDTIPEFSENLRGAKPGEERTFQVNYPEDFGDQRLAGKQFRYTVRVKAVKQKNVPELNDDFAKEVGSFSTLEELKQKIRESLEREKQREAEHQAKDKIVEELVKRHPFEVPESLVEHQIDVRLERGLRALAAQGMRAEEMKKMDFDRLRAGQREAAEREVRASLLLEKVAEAEQLQVSDEEIDSEVQALAQQAQQPADALRARLTQEGALDRIRHRLRNEKALDFLYRRSA